MLDMFRPYLLAFIPLFVAVDAIANIPVFLSITENCSKKQKDKIIKDAVKTAAAVAVIFMSIGKLTFSLLGVTFPDFQIAGGILLFVISVKLLLPGSQKNVLTSAQDKDIGVFPLGTPLITGPAVLTTTLMLMNIFGPFVTLVSLLLNMLIVWGSLSKADLIIRFIGPSGTRAFSKIMYILLAAIAVMMVRRGIMEVFLR